MAIITHPHYKKTYARNGRMLRSSTPTLSSADRVSYGQGCGAAGSVFRVNEATGCSTLFKPSVAKMGTGTIAVCTGVFHVTETGIGNDSSRYSFSADGVAAGAGPRAQSLRPSSPAIRATLAAFISFLLHTTKPANSTTKIDET